MSLFKQERALTVGITDINASDDPAPGIGVAKSLMQAGRADVGQYFFDSGQGRLYFALDPSGFYFYRMDGNDPWLALLFKPFHTCPSGTNAE